jgi:hypothetical protein
MNRSQQRTTVHRRFPKGKAYGTYGLYVRMPDATYASPYTGKTYGEEREGNASKAELVTVKVLVSAAEQTSVTTARILIPPMIVCCARQEH